MRLPIATGIIVLAAGMLQACQTAQSGKAATELAAGQAPQPSAATAQAEQTARLRAQARAYAERLNQGRCATSPEAASFDAAFNAAEKNLPGVRAGDDVTGVPGAQLGLETERTLAEARLDVGDAARIGGCADVASAQYRTVIRMFSGPAYAPYRRRAETGLSALQL
jgi:hypothetical protein